MIEVAALKVPVGELRYVGVDLFEARTQRDGPGLSLKAAHCLLRPTGARVQLVPGDPLSALARTANLLKPADLVVISAMPDAAMSAAWFFMPRVLHARSIVLRQGPPGGRQGGEFERLGLPQVEALASRAGRRRAA
ncbi:MAG: hypothetical protein NUV77_22630 [Thermoguttaceae bacterium]|nr:hypothetical protein [Thermoguttaceae bacterium]